MAISNVRLFSVNTKLSKLLTLKLMLNQVFYRDGENFRSLPQEVWKLQ